MQVIKRVRIGDCSHKDIVRLSGGVIVEVYRESGEYSINRDGEQIICYEIATGSRHLIKADRNIDLINISALKDKQYDPSTANVFADFLEENGHQEAADLLRKEFPLIVEVNQ